MPEGEVFESTNRDELGLLAVGPLEDVVEDILSLGEQEVHFIENEDLDATEGVLVLSRHFLFLRLPALEDLVQGFNRLLPVGLDPEDFPEDLGVDRLRVFNIQAVKVVGLNLLGSARVLWSC
jgi:hypothetical protein